MEKKGISAREFARKTGLPIWVAGMALAKRRRHARKCRAMERAVQVDLERESIANKRDNYAPLPGNVGQLLSGIGDGPDKEGDL